MHDKKNLMYVNDIHTHMSEFQHPVHLQCTSQTYPDTCLEVFHFFLFKVVGAMSVWLGINCGSRQSSQFLFSNWIITNTIGYPFSAFFPTWHSTMIKVMLGMPRVLVYHYSSMKSLRQCRHQNSHRSQLGDFLFSRSPDGDGWHSSLFQTWY